MIYLFLQKFLRMVPEWQKRTEILIGAENLSLLKSKHVLVAGLGGVGAPAAEQLCRAGVGNISIVDADYIHPTNRNRQILALKSTEGFSKTALMEKRLKDINPDVNVIAHTIYLKDETIFQILDNTYDYIIDAIDTLSPKVFFLYYAHKAGFNVVSSMGAGGKFDPTQIQISDLSESYNCTLAKYVRKRLHKLGVHSGIKVVFSPEEVAKDAVIFDTDKTPNKRTTVGTISYMPIIMGCFCASVVIRDLLSFKI